MYGRGVLTELPHIASYSSHRGSRHVFMQARALSNRPHKTKNGRIYSDIHPTYWTNRKERYDHPYPAVQ